MLCIPLCALLLFANHGFVLSSHVSCFFILLIHYYSSIGIPYAIRNAGLVAGIFLLLLVSWMTDKSLRVLIELANFHPKLKDLGVHTYEDLMSIPFGRAGTLFVLVNMYVFYFIGWLVSFGRSRSTLSWRRVFLSFF